MEQGKSEAEVRALLARMVTEAKREPWDAALLSPWQVRDIRTRAGLTQEQMAAELGVTTRTVQRWEKEPKAITKLGSVALRMFNETRRD